MAGLFEPAGNARWWLVPVVLLLVGFGLYRGRAPDRFTGSAAVMGPVTMTVTLANDPSLAAAGPEVVETALAAARAVNAEMSCFVASSDISRLNAAAVGEPVPISRRTLAVLREAQRYHRLSAGAFDVTVGGLMAFYRPIFRGQEAPRLPAAAALRRLRETVGSKALVLDDAGPTAARMRAGLLVDLGAIAKGFAVDEVVAVLKRQGVGNGVVSVGGEVRTWGRHPEGRPWRTGVRDPLAPSEICLELSRPDCAIATSGNYEQFFELEGVRYAHIVDPRTGLPVHHQLVGVTVLAPTCLQADALATALSVLGPDEGRRLLALFPEVEAYLQCRTETGQLRIEHVPMATVPAD